jgi:hypothetical protein
VYNSYGKIRSQVKIKFNALKEVSEMKIKYRVENINKNDIEKELEGYITKYLVDDKTFNSGNKKRLVTLSIRVSYKPDTKSKQYYSTLMSINYSSNYNISEIMETIKSRLINRNINIKTITSFHLHLNYI